MNYLLVKRVWDKLNYERSTIVYLKFVKNKGKGRNWWDRGRGRAKFKPKDWRYESRKWEKKRSSKRIAKQVNIKLIKIKLKFFWFNK